jgi:hypothetical protein
MNRNIIPKKDFNMILKRRCVSGIPRSSREQHIRNDVAEKDAHGKKLSSSTFRK